MRPCRTGWSRSCGWRASATVKPPLRFCRAFLRATIAVRPSARPGSGSPSAFGWHERSGRHPVLARDPARLTAAGRALQPDEVHARSEGDHRAAGEAGGRDLRPCGRRAQDRLEGAWKGLPLAYAVFDKLQRVSHAAIVENKRLGEVLAWIKERQDAQPAPSGDRVGPRRSSQKSGLMKDRADRLAQIAL